MPAGGHCTVNSERHSAPWGSRVVLPAVLITHCNPLPREAEQGGMLELAAIFLGYFEFCLPGKCSWFGWRKFNSFCARCCGAFRRCWWGNPCPQGAFNLEGRISDIANNRGGKVWWKDQGNWTIQTGFSHHYHIVLCKLFHLPESCFLPHKNRML